MRTGEHILESVLLLTKSGFPLDVIYDMPMDALRMYTSTATRLEAARRLEYISDTTAGAASLFSAESGTEYRAALEKIYRG